MVKLEKLKDDNNYALGNKDDNFQDKLLNNVLENEKIMTNIKRKFCH